MHWYITISISFLRVVLEPAGQRPLLTLSWRLQGYTPALREFPTWSCAPSWVFGHVLFRRGPGTIAGAPFPHPFISLRFSSGNGRASVNDLAASYSRGVDGTARTLCPLCLLSKLVQRAAFFDGAESIDNGATSKDLRFLTKHRAYDIQLCSRISR